MTLPSLIVPPGSISVAQSRVFTYPTRLADLYVAAIQEIDIPAHRVARPELRVTISEGSTELPNGALVKSLRSRLKKLRKKLIDPVNLDDSCVYDCRYEVDDNNIAHILNNLVVPILAAQRICPEVIAILRAKASNLARNVFDLLGVKVVCTDAEVQGRIVRVGQAGRDRFAGDGLYASFFNGVQFKGYIEATPRRIFVSRRKTRRLRNEEEVEGVLREFGFIKTYFEDIPISEQWSLSRNASAMVFIHGAALSSVLFNQKGVRLVELSHPGFVTNWGRNMTSASGGAWRGVTGRLPPDIIRVLDYRGDARRFAFDDMEIDVTSLKMALESLGIGK